MFSFSKSSRALGSTHVSLRHLRLPSTDTHFCYLPKPFHRQICFEWLSTHKVHHFSPYLPDKNAFQSEKSLFCSTLNMNFNAALPAQSICSNEDRAFKIKYGVFLRETLKLSLSKKNVHDLDCFFFQNHLNMSSYACKNKQEISDVFKCSKLFSNLSTRYILSTFHLRLSQTKQR